MKAFKLENEPKITTGFKTPENYFDHLSANVLKQINEKEVKVVPIYKRKKNIALLVAAVLIIGLLIPVISHYNTTSKEFDEAALETYLAYQTNISQYDLIKELDTKDIESLNKNNALEEETMEDILASNPNLENLISE